MRKSLLPGLFGVLYGCLVLALGLVEALRGSFLRFEEARYWGLLLIYIGSSFMTREKLLQYSAFGLTGFFFVAGAFEYWLNRWRDDVFFGHLFAIAYVAFCYVVVRLAERKASARR